MSYIYDSAFGDKICDGEVVRINSDGSESMACFLFFDGLTADEYTDDTKCTRISATEDLLVQGIGKGSSLEDAEKLWGKPYKKDDIFAFFLSKSGTERIELKHDRVLARHGRKKKMPRNAVLKMRSFLHWKRLLKGFVTPFAPFLLIL